jgi:putative transposase
MPRLPRFALAGYPQHVIQRGNNRTLLFATAADYQVFRWCLTRACAKNGCRVHAYVLMTNHVHLLMTPRDAAGIGRAMQSLGCGYVGYFNAAYQRTGTLFEGRYRAAPVDTERYLLTCYRYIELNPVRAGLVVNPAEYPWSSHRANALDQIDTLVTPHERYSALGADPVSRRTAYRALFENALDDSLLDEIRESTNKRWALGSHRFRREIAALVGRRVQPLPRGGTRRRRPPST